MSLFFTQYAENMDRDVVPVPGMEAGPVPPWTGRHVPERPVQFPRDIFARGEYPDTFAMWDWVYQQGVALTRGSPQVSGDRSCTSLQPRRRCNKVWNDAVRRVHMSGDWRRLDELSDPPLYSFEFENPELLEAAHTLAHYRMEDVFLQTSREPELHGRLAEEYHRACGELMMCKLFGLPVDVGRRGPDAAMMPYLRVCPSVRTGFGPDAPVLRMPIRTLGCSGKAAFGSLADRVLAHALIVLYLGQDPESRDDCRERNKWSYRPMFGVFAGWETSAYLSTCPVVWTERGYYDPSRRTGDFAAPVDDLQPPGTFREYLEAAKYGHQGLCMKLDDWITTSEYFRLKSGTPPMPCQYCLYTDSGFAEGIQLPGWRRPDNPQKDRAWKEYFGRFRLKMNMIRRALKPELQAARGRKTVFMDRIKELRASRRRSKRW